MKIDEKFIRNLIEAKDEHERINALFELKHEYLRLKTI